MEDNPPHVFISRDMPQPVEKVVYRDVRHADVLALATWGHQVRLDTGDHGVSNKDVGDAGADSALCQLLTGGCKLFPLSCSRQEESARSFSDGILVLFGICMDSSAATWMSVQTTMSLSSDSSLSSSCSWSTANLLDVGTAMKSVVLVGSLGASLLALMSWATKWRAGLGCSSGDCVLIMSSHFVALFSVSCCLSSSAQDLLKKGVSWCDARLKKKVNLVCSFFLESRWSGYLIWLLDRALQWYVGVLRNTLDGFGVV